MAKRIGLLVSFFVLVVFVSGCTTDSVEVTAGSQGNAVEIKNFAFNPAELTVQKGDTVTWTNMDAARHTVTSDEGAELNSELLSTGETYIHTFAESGTYDYHCTPHPFMQAKIIVE